jgi:hypothetical protein
VFGINETSIRIMLLDGSETSEVQQTFIKIKNSMEDLVTTCTDANYVLAGVTDGDQQYFLGRFRSALREKEAFNGFDAAGKLKYDKWNWYGVGPGNEDIAGGL